MNPLMNPVGSNAEGKLNCINAVVITHTKNDLGSSKSFFIWDSNMYARISAGVFEVILKKSWEDVMYRSPSSRAQACVSRGAVRCRYHRSFFS